MSVRLVLVSWALNIVLVTMLFRKATKNDAEENRDQNE